MEMLIVGEVRPFSSADELAVRQAETLAEARRQWLIHPADLLLVREHLPDGDGIGFCQWVQNLGAEPCVLFLAKECDIRLAQALISMRVHRLLEEDASPEEISSAVSEARQALLRHQNSFFEHVSRGFLSWRNGMKDAVSLELFLGSGANLQDIVHGGLLPPERPLTILRIHILEWHLREHWPDALVELALTHLSRHALLESWQHSPAVPMGQDTYAILLWPKSHRVQPSVSHAVETLYQFFQQYLNCVPSLQAETISSLQQAPEIWRSLASSDPVFSEEQSPGKASPEVLLWADLLRGRHPQDLISHLHRYIASRWGGFPPAREDLRQLYLQLLQALDLATDSKKFWTEVLSDPARHDLYVHGNRSLESFFALANLVAESLARLQNTSEISLKEQVGFYLKNHPSENVTCADIAESFKVTPDHLNRLFRRETGETLKSFIIREKLENARHLLILTDMPISRIAEKTGYSNFSHFSSAYKKKYGVSPLETRKAAEQN